ncbi:MAG TPA: DUF58 domain-containing protein [Ilumatobacteraceae bacterium]|nr:DUF58 domain-containing protein [Ilumatobacteraceae bacterium]
MPIPTARFALVVALSAVVVLAVAGDDWSVLWLVEAVLLVVMLADAFAAVSPSSIDVARSHPESIVLGETTVVTWTIENRAERAVHVAVGDALWPSLNATRRRVETVLHPLARHVASARLRPERRGRFPLDEVVVRTRGPLGLAVRHRVQHAPSVLRVMPAFPSRDSIQQRLSRPRVIDVGVRALRVRGSGTEFDQLREMRLGDDPQRIDWAATAKHQRPIVRQVRAEHDQSVVILLDNGRVMAGQIDGTPRVEHAMDAALGLTAVATHLGDRVGLVSFDRSVVTVVPPSHAKTQPRLVAEAMYQLEPELSESAYLSAFSYATARFRRRSLYVVLTELAEAAVEEAILPALPILCRHHLVIVATVQDPLVSEWAAGTGGTAASGMFRQAAAIAQLQHRRRSVARLTAAGAIVIDARPGELATRLVDTYLELKASSRL